MTGEVTMSVNAGARAPQQDFFHIQPAVELQTTRPRAHAFN
jgi:hypothetical protein